MDGYRLSPELMPTSATSPPVKPAANPARDLQSPVPRVVREGTSPPASLLPTPEPPVEVDLAISQPFEFTDESFISQEDISMETVSPTKSLVDVALGAQPRSLLLPLSQFDRARSPDPLLLFTPQRSSAVSPPAPSTPPSPFRHATSSSNAGHINRTPPVDIPSSPLTPAPSPEPRPRSVTSSPPHAEQQPGDDDPIPEHILAEASRPYSLRQRKARQLNPYLYDQVEYKRQLKSNPDAIVPALHSRRRHGSPRQHESDKESGSDADAGNVEDEEDPEEERYWRRMEKRKAGNGVSEQEGQSHAGGIGVRGGRKSKSMEPERGGPTVSTAKAVDTSGFLSNPFSSDDDMEPLALLGRPKKPPEKEKEAKKVRKKRIRAFPMSEKDLAELKARYGDEVRCIDRSTHAMLNELVVLG